MKKILSLFGIILIAAFLGGTLSYVKASYTDPAGNPVGNNVPAPLLLSDINDSGFAGFRKLGKLGITSDKNNSIDDSQLTENALVVNGQVSSEGFAVTNNPFSVWAHLESSSILPALFFGDPTDSSLMQKNANGSSRTFTVLNHTRAPRIVVGSKSAPAGLFNLFVVEESNATNLGINHNPNTVQNNYCTLTANDLKDKGCPNKTYLAQVFPGSGSNVVAVCREIITQDTTYGNHNNGSCY